MQESWFYAEKEKKMNFKEGNIYFLGGVIAEVTNPLLLVF